MTTLKQAVWELVIAIDEMNDRYIGGSAIDGRLGEAVERVIAQNAIVRDILHKQNLSEVNRFCPDCGHDSGMHTGFGCSWNRCSCRKINFTAEELVCKERAHEIQAKSPSPRSQP